MQFAPFLYPIYPIELNDELCTQLSKNPNFILQGFMGMQTQIQQAVSDLGINLEDYGREGKGNTRSKGKGKGKRNERSKGYQSDMYRNQAEEEQDTDEDFKPKGGKGAMFAYSVVMTQKLLTPTIILLLWAMNAQSSNTWRIQLPNSSKLCVISLTRTFMTSKQLMCKTGFMQ